MSKVTYNCHTGRHSYHTYVPWMYSKDYKLHCDICGHSAAWHAGVEGDFPALCDCHAEDWSRYCDIDRRIRNTRHVKQIWPVVYADFKRDVLSGLFVPNDFKAKIYPPVFQGYEVLISEPVIINETTVQSCKPQ